MKFNKRGVSGVIVSVLMILLVLAAVGILWAVIQSFTKDSLEGIGGTADCLSLNLEIVSATSSEGQANIVIKRIAGEGNLETIQILIEDSTGTIASGAGSGIIPEIGESKTLIIADSAIQPGQTVKIAGVINGKQCDVSDTAIIN